MWGQIGAAAGGALAGALGGGGGSETIHAMDSIPRALREPWLDLAGGVFDLQTPEYFQGQLIADQNPWLQAALQGMGNYDPSSAAALTEAGMGLLPQLQQGAQMMNQFAMDPSAFRFDQGTYDQVYGNLMGGTQGVFDAGAGQINQNFNWNQMPGLNMAGAMAGGSGSTKLGQQNALTDSLRRQEVSQFGSGLFQNAANMATRAGMDAGTQNLGFQQNLLDQFQQYGALGAGLIGQGFDMDRGILDMGMNAGQFQLGYDQSLIDAEMDRWNFEQMAPWTALQTQLGMLPGPGGFSPGTPGMSPWEGALQGAQAGLGLWDAFGNANSGGNSGGMISNYNWSTMNPAQFASFLQGG